MGGALDIHLGNLTVNFATWTGNSAVGGVGGTGGLGGAGFNGGNGGLGAAGGNAFGGAISASDNIGNVILFGTSFVPTAVLNNFVISGAAARAGPSVRLRAG